MKYEKLLYFISIVFVYGITRSSMSLHKNAIYLYHPSTLSIESVRSRGKSESLLNTTGSSDTVMDMNLDSIADKAGLYDSSHLIAFFKRHMGITPGRYRKNQ